ncbi:SWIM zinc finger family protein [Streptomyces sp. NPDC001500]
MPPDEPTDEPADDPAHEPAHEAAHEPAHEAAHEPAHEGAGPATGSGPGAWPSSSGRAETPRPVTAGNALPHAPEAHASPRPSEAHAPFAAAETPVPSPTADASAPPPTAEARAAASGVPTSPAPHVIDPIAPAGPGPSPTAVTATEAPETAPSPKSTAPPSGSGAGAAPIPPAPTSSSPSTSPAGAVPPAVGDSAPARSAEPARAPRSMAAPSRDGDHRRTFPPFPPRTGGSFAETWWGNAWVAALEEGALDVKRLVRGRGYAEQGNVDAITVTPGLVLAYVQGSRPRPYRVQVRLRTLGDDDWERFLDAAVERPGHIAALLDKEMPESLADCGVPLLPGPGDLEPQCSCPDRGHPCKHAAALCYQTARLLDADPFVLLLLRGRGEREVLDALSRRNAVRAARAAQEQDQQPEPLAGVRAAEALAERRLPPLPAPLPLPAHPEQPPAYPSAPDGPDSFALDHLATDAAARAHALLMTGRDEIGGLTLWQDAVRLAASRPGSGLTAATRSLYASLASAAGRTPSDLARAVAAWRQGGPDGLTVLEESWDPPAGRFDRARPLLLAADLPAFRPRRNHLTHPRGHVQLRYGQNGLWYAYESEPGHDDWWPRGTPDSDPVGALTGLGGSDEL